MKTFPLSEPCRPSRRHFTTLATIVALFMCSSNVVMAEVTERHEQVAHEVFERLIALVDRPEGYDSWPPQLIIVDDDTPNAWAWLDQKALKTEGKKHPVIGVHTGEIELVAQFDPDALAFTIGHEIGHIVLRHSITGLNDPTEVVQLAYGHQKELDADLFGMQLALEAGYAFEGAMQNLKNVLHATHPYCTYEGLVVTHPSWADRIALMDSSHEALWNSMSAFQNGVFFLQVEQYRAAEFCFERVVKEFPDCYEAWANLGYARLMQYCDDLEPQDLKTLDVGHLVVGGFYARPEWLEAMIQDRGEDEELWFEIVDALRRALDLKGDLLLAKANLAIAHLVRPSGKEVGPAAQLFSEVTAALEENTPEVQALDPLARAALLLNSSVAQIGVSTERSEAILAEAEELLNHLAGQHLIDAERSPLVNAMRYNRAMVMLGSDVDSDRRAAAELLGRYLSHMPPTLAWWEVAYEHYGELCNELGIDSASPEELAAKSARTRWRLLTTIELGDLTIALSSPTEEIEGLLDEPTSEVPVVSGSNLRRLNYTEHGISILASKVINAIFLSGPNAPRLVLRSSGLGSELHEIYIGMPRDELERLLGGDRPMKGIDSNSEMYYVYDNLGLAVMFRDGEVVELAIAQLARRRSGRG